MKLFRKNKKKSDCCNVVFESTENKENSKSKKSCCDFKIEEDDSKKD